MPELRNVHEVRGEGEVRVGLASVSIAPTWPVVLPYGKQVPTTEFYNRNIYCKALVLRVGDATAALIACDVIGFRREIADYIRDAVEAECGISGDLVMIAATHNHSYPRLSDERVRDFVRDRVVEAVREALDSMFRARIGFGKARLPAWLNVNRARPDGPVDTTLYVMRIDDPSGALRGVVFSFPSHPNTHTTAWGGRRLGKIGPEWPEYVRKYVEATIERELMFELYPRVEFRDVFTMFLLGAAGDLQPALATYRRGGKLIDRKRAFVEELGEAIVDLVSKVETRPRASLTFRWGEVGLTLREDVLESVRRRVSEELKRGEVPERYVEVARELLRGRYYARVQALIMDDACLCTAPGEVTAELGLAFQERSGFEYPILVTVANDYLGYFVSEAMAIENVRYEARGSYLDSSRGRVLVNALLSLVGSGAKPIRPVDPERDLGSVEGRLIYDGEGEVYVGVKRECNTPSYGEPPAAPFLGRRVRVGEDGRFRFDKLAPGVAYLYVDEVVKKGERPRLLMWGEPVLVRAGQVTKVELRLPRELGGRSVEGIEVTSVEVDGYTVLCDVRVRGELGEGDVVRGYLFRYGDTLRHHKTHLYSPLAEAVEVGGGRYAFTNVTPGDYAILFWIDVNGNGRPEPGVDVLSPLRPLMIEDFLGG